MSKLGELRGFTAYIIFIVVAEVVTSFVDPGYGLILYAVILLSFLTLSSLKFGENTKLYLILSFAPLIRIISLSMRVQVICSIILILLLASKEMVVADTRKSLKAFDKSLTIVILPLFISFTLNISKILGFL